MIAPPRLRPGDRIGIVAPSSPVRRRLALAGVRVLEREGFRVVLGRHVLDRRGHLAGPDEARAADFNRMLRDPDIRCVLLARGGYGAMRMEEAIDWSAARRDPKVFAGFSDATYLHLAFAVRAGLRTLHGPNLQGLGPAPAAAVRRWIEWVTLRRPSDATRTLCAPRRLGGPLRGVRGRVHGGNIMLLQCSIGTGLLRPLRGALLVLEEVGESPYRIDRMLTHLRVAGALRGVRAVATGSFKGCVGRKGYTELSLAAVLRDRLGTLGVPALAGLPAGHGERNLPFPLGAIATLDPRRGRLVFEQGLVS